MGEPPFPVGDPLDLRRVRQFMAVADRLSITRAASELHMTQQALSTSIARLEAQLGVSLLDRGARQVALTPAGRMLRTGADVLLAAADDLVRQLRHAATSQPRPFAVGHSPSVSAEEVHRILAPVRSGMPELPITVMQLYPHAVEPSLLDGTIDVALRRGITASDRFASTVVAYDQVRVAVRHDHPLATRASVRIEELRTERIIVWAPPGASFYTDFILGTCRRAGFEPDTVVNRVQGTPPSSAVLDNDGVAFVTDPPGPTLGGQVMVLRLDAPVSTPVQALWLPHTFSEARSVLISNTSETNSSATRLSILQRP